VPIDPTKPGETKPGESPDPLALYVVVEATRRHFDPIAIPPVDCHAPGELCAVVQDVMAGDAKLSGVVKPLEHPFAKVNLPREPRRTWEPDWASYKGAKFLLAARVEGSTVGVLVDWRLYRVADKKLVEVKGPPRQRMAPGKLRLHVHRYMNALVEALTGTRGVFDTQIFFARRTAKDGRGIFRMDMDGANEVPIVTDPGIHMFPSPGRSGLLYVSFRGGKPDLFRLPQASSTLGRMMRPAATPMEGDVAPPGHEQLSRDDNQYRKGSEGPDGRIVVTINDGDQADVWLLDSVGNPLKNLTKHPSDDLSPTWSPDGRKIAFVSNRQGGPQIFVMDEDGTNVRRITYYGGYNVDPDWGPDGRIVYSASVGTAIDVVTIDLQGRMQRLTPSQGRCWDPTWSPDGRHVVYVSDEGGGKSRIWVSTADGAARHPVSRTPSEYFTPAWNRVPAGERALK